MKWRAGLLITLLLTTPAAAQTGADVCRSTAGLQKQVSDNLGKGGLRALAPLVPDIEQALSGARACFPSLRNADGSLVILADGGAETLMAAVSMATKNIKGSTLYNPFPQFAVILGSYFNEIGKPEDALRALAAGLLLSPFPEERLGRNVPALLAEKGAALNALKRFDEALRDYDEALKIKGLADADQARMHRGRGFALTELDRLDEAENAYRDALKIAPADARALHELAYIAELRAGTAKHDFYLTTAPPPGPGQDVAPEQRAEKPAAPN